MWTFLPPEELRVYNHRALRDMWMGEVGAVEEASDRGGGIGIGPLLCSLEYFCEVSTR